MFSHTIPLTLYWHTLTVIIMLAAPSYLECLKHRQPITKEFEARLQDPELHWNETDGVIHDAGGQIIIIGDVSLWNKIILLTHDVPHIGHPGIGKMVDLLERDYWWLALQKDMAEYVKSYILCQQTKVFSEEAHRLLHQFLCLLHHGNRQLQILSHYYPTVRGYDVILVVVD
jgi:hypothetical protein